MTTFMTRGRRAFEKALKAIKEDDYASAARWMMTGMDFIKCALNDRDRLGPRHRPRRPRRRQRLVNAAACETRPPPRE